MSMLAVFVLHGRLPAQVCGKLGAKRCCTVQCGQYLEGRVTNTLFSEPVMLRNPRDTQRRNTVINRSLVIYSSKVRIHISMLGFQPLKPVFSVSMLQENSYLQAKQRPGWNTVGSSKTQHAALCQKVNLSQQGLSQEDKTLPQGHCSWNSHQKVFIPAFTRVLWVHVPEKQKDYISWER